jgi:predicted  nucleic acid-binding Zn-ribbon protein
MFSYCISRCVLQIKTLDQRINKVKDRVFKAFSKSVGVKNMREHETRLEAALKEVQDRQSRLRRQIAELHTEEDRIRSTLQELDLKRERYHVTVKVCQLPGWGESRLAGV